MNMYRNTAKPHTEYGRHNHPHKVTLSALKTKHKYIHINTPNVSPQSVELKTSFTLPLGQQQQSVIPNQWVSYDAVSLCTVLGSQSFSYKAQGSAGLHR